MRMLSSRCGCPSPAKPKGEQRTVFKEQKVTERWSCLCFQAELLLANRAIYETKPDKRQRQSVNKTNQITEKKTKKIIELHRHTPLFFLIH